MATVVRQQVWTGFVARRAARGETVSVQAAIGFTGLAAGPQALIVDPFALADPLLARLPPEPGQKFLAGHLRRAIPPGYLEARRTGSSASLPPELRGTWEQLRLVTSGPLFAPERLRAIVDFQLGRAAQRPRAAGG